MTTRTGARVYRGAPRDRLAAGACPGCNRSIGTTPSGRRRLHRDLDDVDCTGSGALIAAEVPDVDPDAVMEAWAEPGGNSRWQNRDHNRPAGRWSGKP